jgi:hypothetical protein
MKVIRIVIGTLLLYMNWGCKSSSYSSGNGISVQNANDRGRAAMVFYRNEAFFNKVISDNMINDTGHIYFFSKHCGLKSGFIIWEKNGKPMSLFYDLDNKETNDLSHKVEMAVRINTCFLEIKEHNKLLLKNLIKSEITPSHPCFVDIFEREKNKKDITMICSFKIEDINRRIAASQPLIDLININDSLVQR